MRTDLFWANLCENSIRAEQKINSIDFSIIIRTKVLNYRYER